MAAQHRLLNPRCWWNIRRGAVMGLAVTVFTAHAIAAKVAVIDQGPFNPGLGQGWCNLLLANGNECTLFPPSGPTVALGDFDVVIDLSTEWTDPGKALRAHVASGRGVIVSGAAAVQLGITVDPLVQEWIGANDFQLCGDRVLVAEAAPILPGWTIGTTLTICSDTPCIGLTGTSGHPEAVVVARCEFGDSALLLRNPWRGGRSVFLQNLFSPSPNGGFVDDEIILNAVRWAAGEPKIPTTSTWSLIALTLLLASAGTVLLRRRAGVCVR